jgi:hypothetical protein
MTVLAKLRRAARPIAMTIVALAVVASANAFALAASIKTSPSAEHCKDMAELRFVVSIDTSAKHHEPSGDAEVSHAKCCEQDCDCPVTTGVFALILDPFCHRPPPSSAVEFPSVLPLEDRRPSDLLRPPI